VNVLLVEDEPRVADFINRGLRAENHGVTVASSGTEGVDLAKNGEFDVIVLDLMLPDMHGYDVCQRLRLEGDHTPILMLTAMDALEDKIKGLKMGADDYLTKPFDLDEVLARMRAVMRRHAGRGSPEVTYGALTLDPVRRMVHFRGAEVGLSTREFMLLEALMKNPGALVPRERLVDAVYGWDTEVESNSIEVHLHHLRRKLCPELILNVRGVGYRLVPVA
jgi:two-component system response regulator QseB